MQLPVRLPVFPSQCYYPTTEYRLESHHHGVSAASRQPLGESTGNAQHSQMAWYAERIPQIGAVNGLTSMSPSIPTPPIVPTQQSLVSEYGSSSAYARPPQQRHHSVHGYGRRRPYGDNPIMALLTQAFQNYRKKQADKSEQKWPDVLEEAFVDALVLIPQMKRKKYTMKQTQYGRNMLIGEYLWIAYCQSLPPGVEPDPLMVRERKQVSSHIQVLKKFIETNRYFHFLFGVRSNKKDKDNDIVENISLKNNPILIALSEGRLPEERPNYEYFAKILALNDQVTVRPKRCWIFVSNQDVAVREDGSGIVKTTNDRLDENEYPHLARNLERESWAKEEQQIFKGALLHEFTKEIQQIESSSVSYLSKEWEVSFPELHRRLKSICNTTTDARCTILHMNVTLEGKDKRGFPSHSELNSWVEMNIEQPALLNHRWKVHTKLVRPKELIYSSTKDANSEGFYETTAEIAIQYQHRPGCEGPRHCMSQRCRRDWVTVPFPADVWAETLTNCAEYPAHPFVADIKRHYYHHHHESIRQKQQDSSNNEEEDESTSAPKTSSRRNRNKPEHPPTQMDLVPKIGMMQEIWSCSPESASHEQPPSDSSNGGGGNKWQRRAVIFWTFQTIHSIDHDSGQPKLVTAQSGNTKWQFLTILCPTSDYHQQQAIVTGGAGNGRRLSSDEVSSSPVRRDLVMSPSPTYQQQLSASMSETFSNAAAWGDSHSHAAQAAYNAHLLSQNYDTSYGGGGGSGNGLVTPPPSATALNTSFGHHSFDVSGYTGMDTLSSLAAVTDPFLSVSTSLPASTTTAAAASFDVGGGGISPYDQTGGQWNSTTGDGGGGVWSTYSTAAQNGWNTSNNGMGVMERNQSFSSDKSGHLTVPPSQPWIITSGHHNGGTEGGEEEGSLWTPATSICTPITGALNHGLDDWGVGVGTESQDWSSGARIGVGVGMTAGVVYGGGGVENGNGNRMGMGMGTGNNKRKRSRQEDSSSFEGDDDDEDGGEYEGYHANKRRSIKR
ncbi:regulatory protein abaA [Podospora fimiseda]|uniref:Regulatory protein abaA n=1 Tax=Podospora fimiseda TaxID=252190 RepID=A0AAN7H1X1_9PEZI|nr:regulatory protein abaA [Podospora fimiseda]